MNIFLLISDTFRYDNFFDRAAAGPLGMPVRTPNLDAFSERAVSCTRMYNASFPTIPHRTDLTTGRYGWPWYPWQSRLKSSPNHLPQVLAKCGYSTQLICDCPHLYRADFDDGFHAAVATRGQEGDLNFLHLNDPIANVMPREKTRDGHHFQGVNLPDLSRWQNADWRYETDCFPPRTATLAMHWLEANYRHEPLFLWVDWFDPHEPWDPPEYLVRRYDPDYDGCPMIHPNYGKAGDLTPAELRNLRAHYCAEAELVDRWVGRVLQKIDDLRLWDNSIVVFTTDHGFSIGERDRTGKSNINSRDDRYWPVYPEVAHIPFLVAAPGVEGGREIDAIVQPPDILPTLADLAGVQIETPEPIHGRSFAPLVRGESDAWERDFAVTASFLRLGEEGMLRPRSVTPVVYTKQWAYAPIGQDGERELFDAAADPYCTTDLAAANPAVCDDLHSKLIGFLKGIDAPPESIAPFE
ncbi:MAG TPA: sulfatase [Phycisphaerae bacterium]|nr:sulfatase [Phycisphaerae bacterium]